MKQLIPLKLKKYYWRFLRRQQKLRKKRIKFKGKSPKEVFTLIYNTNYWSGHNSISGGGSDLHHTKVVINEVSTLIKEYGFSTVLDVPCGDFLWMQYVDMARCSYLGGDIVEDLIRSNQETYAALENVRFEVMDLLKHPLPKYELFINRDCMVHLSYQDIFQALDTIKKSGCRYLLTTTFPDHPINSDIDTGDWRPLNLEKPPFNFPKPIHIIKEQFQHKAFYDKSLGLWKIDEIVIHCRT